MKKDSDSLFTNTLTNRLTPHVREDLVVGKSWQNSLAALVCAAGICVDSAQGSPAGMASGARPPAMQAQPTFPGAIALTLGYGMMGLAAERHPLDKATAAMTHWMLATQMPDGSWLGNGVNRPPMEFSTVSHTVIAARGLTLYPIPARRAQVCGIRCRGSTPVISESSSSSSPYTIRVPSPA